MDLVSTLSAIIVACVVYFFVHRVANLFTSKGENLQHGDASDENKGDAIIEADSNDELAIRILFGTQTGTAEKLAKEMRSKIYEAYGTEAVKVYVEDVECYRPSERFHNERYVFLFVATYGDGEPTDTAVEFDQWLTEAEDVGEDILHGVRFGVMALGNREYEHFCIFGIKVDRIMERLGAQRIVDRVDGDDSKSIEDDFENFATNAMDALAKEEAFRNIHADGPQKPTAENVPAYKVVFDPVKKMQTGQKTRSAGQKTDIACVSSIRELHTERSDRSCVHVELDISMSDVTYQAGDHVAIQPENCPELVEEAAALLGCPLDTCFSLEMPTDHSEELETPFPGPLTLREALMKYADLTNPPQKHSLKLLSAFATNAEEADQLLFLSSIEGREKFNQMVHNNAMSLLELMQEFPSAKPELGAFFGSICPRVQPRYYSISSSSAQTPHHIHVTAAVVHEKKPSGKIHKGVCTNWLSTRELGARAAIHVRTSHFKLPSDPSVPIVMVGPGTGIAPFRGFLQERAKLNASGVSLGPALLFFGCRHPEMDYIYQEELEGYVNDGTLTALHVAFSRETDKKVYVQQKLLENSTLALSHTFSNALCDVQRKKCGACYRRRVVSFMCVVMRVVWHVMSIEHCTRLQKK